MNKPEKGPSLLEKLAALIVDKRSLIFFLYGAAIMVSIFSQGWVSVCDDLTAYLPDQTETRRGLDRMEEEVVTYGTARIMLSHVTAEIGWRLAEQMEAIEGVSSVTYDESDQHFQGTDALLEIHFSGEAQDEASVKAMEAIKGMLEPYDHYIFSEVGYSLADTLETEMGMILAIAALIIVAVLTLTSRSYAEVLVLLLTFGAAALLNRGTNFIFGEISFVSNSVTVVLQLALAIDYAIILLHQFTEEREHYDDRQACIRALSYSIPAISASSLTTISGLAAMMFMQFRIGSDMALVLIKAIFWSMLSVFTLMPGLLIIFSKLMLKTKHREFVPKIDRWGKLVVKLRFIGVPLFALALVGGFLLSKQCPFFYGNSTAQLSRQNDSQIAEEKINAAFGAQNMMALLVPKGNYAQEKALLAQLETYEEVSSATGLANTEARDGYTLTDKLTPRQFAEMTDMDYEVITLLYSAYAAHEEDYGKVIGGISGYSVPLMDMFLFLYDQKEEGYVQLDTRTEEDMNDLYEQLTEGRAQMLGPNYSRLLINLNLPEEGEETFAFLQTIHQEAERYYDAENIYLVGDSTSDYDLSISFVRDNQIISILSVVFVILILLFSFQSVGLPLLLILVIQGSVWINFSFPAVGQKPIFFMSYLVVTAIQMGANIDYAIVISSRYTEMKAKLPLQEAIVQALNLAFPTVLTSGSIMASAGFLIGRISTTPSIVGIGQCLCRGTLISIFLVLFVLPQMLLLGDLMVEKTRFNLKMPVVTKNVSGTVYVDGRVRGKISGVVDATMHGVIHGDVSAVMDTGIFKEMAEEEENDGQNKE